MADLQVLAPVQLGPGPAPAPAPTGAQLVAGPVAVAVPGRQGDPGGPGPRGISVAAASIVDHRLHLTLSDGSTLDAGPLPDLAAAFQAAADAGTAAAAAETARLEAIAAAARLQIGGSLPTPAPGASALWVDTTGGNLTLNLVTGD